MSDPKKFDLSYYPRINNFLCNHVDFLDEDIVDPDLGGWVVTIEESGAPIYGWIGEDGKIHSLYINDIAEFDDPIAFAVWANKTRGEENGMSAENSAYNAIYSEFVMTAHDELSKAVKAVHKLGLEAGLKTSDVEDIIADAFLNL